MGAFGSFVSVRIAELSERPMIQQVDHYVRLTRNVTLPPMQVHKMVGSAKIPILTKRLNVVTESLPSWEAIAGVEAIEGYETFKQGANRVTLGLWNNTRQKITLKKGTRVAHVVVANVVPPMLAMDLSTVESELRYTSQEHVQKDVLESTNESMSKPVPTAERLNELFTKLDLKGTEEWPDNLQQKVHDLLVEYQHLFALNDLELGKTSKVKHQIKLNNNVPFKDRYWRIPPQEFDEVHRHLEEMLKIGAIQKSVSPWASPVVLVRKKDGSLRFCIDLRKLNS